MFTALSEQVGGVLRRLTGRGVLNESDVATSLREIRRHLLEADVHYDVARDLTERARERALGSIRVKTVNPGQQVVKIVHDELAATLGAAAGDRSEPASLRFKTVGVTVILLVGLQGSGKTTTAAKLAGRLRREQKAPCIVAADASRPAAGEQTAELGRRVGVPVFGAIPGHTAAPVVDIVRDAMRAAERARCRTAIVDTAGRMQIDAALMAELGEVKAAVDPSEVLLVADGMTGQDAVRIAQGFHEGVGLTGVILTKLDGDTRGGAALSMFAVTGVPIRFVGVGEAVGGSGDGSAGDAPVQLDVFDPVRMAGRILGQGDVVTLVEHAAAAVGREGAERLERKVRSKRGMDLEDFLASLRQMRRMGPLKQLAGLLPEMNAKALAGVGAADENRLRHLEAIILAMTPEERSSPALLNGSRRSRIARGAGRPVQEVNRLLEQFQQMRKFLKRM